MKWRACAGLLALLAAGCTGMPQHSGAVPEAAQMRAEPDRLILLTVANPPESVASRAGSTLRGYDTLPAYTTGDSASATVAALARDYGL
ncbi:MAG: serine protease, partial [Stenotrophobium sp.]